MGLGTDTVTLTTNKTVNNRIDTLEEYEMERASNSYLMSIIFITFSLGFPIVNLIATVVFYAANRKSSPFVRWHCTQAMLSQLSLFFINSVLLVWVIVLFTPVLALSDAFIAFALTVLFFNFLEFVSTISAAVKTRKGKHVSWLFYGPLTDYITQK